TQIQRCVIHQVRQSLQYVSWKDRKAFAADLRTVYGAPTREAAEERLLELGERWGEKYAVAVRSWERNWLRHEVASVAVETVKLDSTRYAATGTLLRPTGRVIS
ncbi:MAG: hypothetical protein AVDCRST_MAG93-8768, partial [uncultured Chloroflexia bacterium]